MDEGFKRELAELAEVNKKTWRHHTKWANLIMRQLTGFNVYEENNLRLSFEHAELISSIQKILKEIKLLQKGYANSPPEVISSSEKYPYIVVLWAKVFLSEYLQRKFTKNDDNLLIFCCHKVAELFQRFRANFVIPDVSDDLPFFPLLPHR